MNTGIENFAIIANPLLVYIQIPGHSPDKKQHVNFCSNYGIKKYNVCVYLQRSFFVLKWHFYDLYFYADVSLQQITFTDTFLYLIEILYTQLFFFHVYLSRALHGISLRANWTTEKGAKYSKNSKLPKAQRAALDRVTSSKPSRRHILPSESSFLAREGRF